MFNIRVIMLIMLSFVLGTCEYVVIGILPNIAEDLNVSITQTGLFDFCICHSFIQWVHL